MGETQFLFTLGAIGITALACQWLAWRLRLPAILFLLLAGILAGPITGWLSPDELFGKQLFGLVSLAVALILFEGSLTLRREEWADIGQVVKRLVTIGALCTWVVITLTSHWLIGFDWPLAILFGSLTLVTGPTVIVPMLRVMRAKTSVANILRWEGIVIDPLGALLAVVVFSFLVSHSVDQAWGQSLLTFAKVVICGTVLGIGIGMLFGLVLRHHLLPEYLHTLAAVSLVLGTFITANHLVHESGLLAVTLMGICLANMRDVSIKAILEFKENLSVLLISGLFILLAARVDLGGLLVIGPAAALLLLVIQLVARPLSVALSTAGSSLSWRERALLGWIAPRGIVAAAVSAIFAQRMAEAGFAKAELLVSLTFLVIIGTVVIQSATASLAARLLGVREPHPRGFLIIGANPVARTIARGLQRLDAPVLLVDSSWDNLRQARMENLPVYFGNPTSQETEGHLDLSGMAYLLGLSTSAELNALAGLHYRHDFPSERRFTLPTARENRLSERHRNNFSARGQTIGYPALSYPQMAGLINRGAELRQTTLSSNFSWAEYQQLHGQQATLLFARNPQGKLQVASEPLTFTPGENWTLLALIETDSPLAVTNQGPDSRNP